MSREEIPGKNSSVVAIVPAAGSSTRMGSARSKALLELCGRTILERSLASLLGSGEIPRIVVLAPRDQLQDFRRLPLPPGVEIIEGGATRQESVSRGLAHLSAGVGVTGETIVAVHDAARCLVSPELVGRAIEGARRHGAVTTAVRCVDSLTRVDESLRVECAVSRAGVWAVQTPQVFRYSLLAAAHQNANAEATDDASLVEKIHPVHIVEGERTNFKITTPEDLELAGALLDVRARAAASAKAA